MSFVLMNGMNGCAAPGSKAKTAKTIWFVDKMQPYAGTAKAGAPAKEQAGGLSMKVLTGWKEVMLNACSHKTNIQINGTGYSVELLNLPGKPMPTAV
jgi:hypothetical protein